MPATIGDLLRTAGVISPEQLKAARDYQKANRGSLGHALVTLGFVSDDNVAKLLSRLYDLPCIDLERDEPDPAVIRMLPAEMARKFQVVPVSVTGRVLTIATADPTNVIAVDNIAFRTGCNVKQVVAPESALKRAIDRYYGSTSSVPTRPGDLGAGVADPTAMVPSAGRTAAPVFLHPPTRALWSLVAVNVAIFALELLWGGSSSPLTLFRMGAGLGRAGLAHEPWRVVSAAFLHVNIVHLALNMWALVVFGRMLEVMLGARRFVVLYGLSALGGGLASSLVHAQILSAGASGAVWGLMTAQIALLVRLKRLYGPEAVPVPMSALLKPLVINLLFSLLPFIDLSAHLGGGAVGAGLIFSGLMWGPRPSAGWRPAAWAASLAMAGCMAIALAHGRPWQLRWPPPLEPRAIAGTPMTLPVPRGLTESGGGKDDVVFGEPSSPLVVYCTPQRLDAAWRDSERRAYLSKTAREIAAQKLDKGWSDEQSPRVIELRGQPAVSWIVRSPTGQKQMTWVFLEGSWSLRLDVMLRPGAPASWASLPSRIAAGVTMPPAGR
jgi:membrane associated rhomboid family serine protease